MARSAYQKKQIKKAGPQVFSSLKGVFSLPLFIYYLEFSFLTPKKAPSLGFSPFQWISSTRARVERIRGKGEGAHYEILKRSYHTQEKNTRGCYSICSLTSKLLPFLLVYTQLFTFLLFLSLPLNNIFFLTKRPPRTER